MENSAVNPKLPKLALTVAVLGLIMGALSLAAAVRHLSYLPGAVLPIAAAITILRRRAWGGYGFALVALAQMLLIPILLMGGSSISARQTWMAVIFEAGLAILFFFAGRALSRTGASAGARWPWIGLAVALTVPFLFVRAYVMPSGSMENTVLIGDHLLVRVFPRPTPKPGRFDCVSLSGRPERDLCEASNRRRRWPDTNERSSGLSKWSRTYGAVRNSLVSG